MKFYELTIDRDTNWEWNAIILDGENNRYDFVKNIESDQGIQTSDPVMMHLICKQGVKAERREKPFEADIIFWGDDLTLRAYKPFGATCMIMSERLKGIIQSYSLPPHSCYPIHLINYEDETQTKQYFLFHIKGRLAYNIDYAKSTYSFTNRQTRERIKDEKGLFKSFEEFDMAEKEAFSNNVRLEISKKVLAHSYDIIWGFANTLVINDIVKQRIESAGIKGAEMMPTRFEIIT